MNSLWLDLTNKLNNFPTLANDISTDVCIIGGGMFGITCSYYLAKLGFKTVILEKDTIGSNTTGHTTAKITSRTWFNI